MAAVLAAATVVICFIAVDWYTSQVVLDAYRSAVIRLTDVARGYYLDCKHGFEADAARLAAGFDGADPALLVSLADLAETPADARAIFILSSDGETVWSCPDAGSRYAGMYDDLMLQAALDGRSVSDPARVKDETLMVAAAPFSTQDEQTWALVICTEFAERYVNTMSSISGKDIMFLMGAEITACSSPDLARDGLTLPDDFLDSVTHRLDADATELEQNGVAYLAGAIPVLDFDEWDIKGYVGVLAPREGAAEAARGSRLLYWSAAAISLALLVLGLMSAVRRMRRRLATGRRTAASAAGGRARVFALVACTLLPSVIVVLAFSGILVPSVVREINSMASRTAGMIVESQGWEACRSLGQAMSAGSFAEGALDSALTRISQLSAADVTVFLPGWEVADSTLSEADQAAIEAPPVLWHELETSDLATSGVKIRGVPHEAVVITLRDDSGWAGWIMMTTDSSVCQNRITGYQFAVLGITAVAIAATGVCFFVMTNTDKGTLLRNTLVGYTFVAPSLIHLLWWGLLPLVFALYLAFHSWSIVTPARPFVGLANFREVFHDRIYWNAMKNTLIYLLHIPFGMALSMTIALALNRRARGITVWRAVYYLPAITSSVVTSIMWKWMYNPEFGLFNYLLGRIGLGPYPWLTRPGWAMLSLIIMTVWQSMGQNMLIFLAGLQGIPSEYYEAASLDGADGFRKFLYITLPLLKPTTFFILVTSVIGSFQVFTPIFVLTGGGPLRSTDVVVYRIYQTAWVDMRMGYASAQAWVLFAIILALTAIQFRLMGKEIRYV